MSWISDGIDAISGLFSGGSTPSPIPTPPAPGGGFNWGSVLTAAVPAAITGAGQFLQGQGTADRAQATLDAQSAENEKNRQFEKEMLMLKLAQGSGGGGSGVDPRALYQTAAANQAKTVLEGAQLPIGALARMVESIQRGLGGVGR